VDDAAPVPAADAALPPEPVVDPSVRDACKKLHDLQCAEGADLFGCERVVQKVLDERLTAVPLDCIVGASSKTGVRACGAFIKCP
jgi:hypothetical protein